MIGNRSHVNTKLNRQWLGGCNFVWPFLSELVVASGQTYHCGRILYETHIVIPL